MAGLNLHQVVRGAITSVHPDIDVELLRSVGNDIDDSGFSLPQYAPIQRIRAQVQSEGDAALFHSDHVGMNSIIRKIYLFAPKEMALQAASIVRPLSRTGDYIRMPDGTWWLVIAVLENFSGVNWIGVRAQLQVEPPTGYSEEEDGPGG